MCVCVCVCVQVRADDIQQFGIPLELCTSLLLLANKLSSLACSLEEYVLLKAVLLLNPGSHSVSQFMSQFVCVTSVTRDKNGIYLACLLSGSTAHVMM